MPQMPMTPPVLAHLSICSSVMLRTCSRKASGLEWEKITGFGRDLHDLEAGLAAGMRAIHQHADAVDLLHHGAAERGQPAILVMAAGRDRVVEVVGEMDLPHAEIAEQAQHRQVVFQHGRAFEIEGDGELALALGALHVLDRAGQQIAVAVLGDPVAKAGDHADALRQRVEIHADIQRDEGGAGAAVPLDRREILVGLDRHAGMAVPDDRLPVDFRRFLDGGDVHAHTFSTLEILGRSTPAAHSSQGGGLENL